MVAASAESPGHGVSGRAVDLIPFGLGLGVIVVAFAIAFLPSIQWILSEWSASSGTLSHGYLVAAISVYLFVTAIPQAATVRQDPMWAALPVLLTLSTIWLLGQAATIIAIQTVVLPAMLLSAIALSFGLAVTRKFAFAIVFIYFAMPAIEHLQPIFQTITVLAVRILIRLTDIPALVEGNIVFVPRGEFQIAGGCSGLNFVVAGLSLAVFFGHLFFTTNRQNLKLISAVLALTMFGNWVRVFSIIVIGYRSNMQSPMVDDHLTLGWIIFAVLMVPAYVIARKIESSNISDNRNQNSRTHSVGKLSPNWGAVIVTIAAMIIGPVWANSNSRSHSSSDSLAIEFPAGTLDWTGPGESNWGWQPRFTNPTVESVVEYRSGSDVVLVYANVYLSQDQGRELIYFSNNLGGDWRVSPSDDELPKTVRLDDGAEYGQIRMKNYVGDWLIWYRYQNGDKFDASAKHAKLSQALQTLKGNPEAGIVAFAILCREQCDPASTRLATFIDQVGHKINLNIVRQK